MKAWRKAIDLALDPALIVTRTPYEGAVKALRALVDEGHSILYISNRKQLAEEATLTWLTDQGFPFDNGSNLICTTEQKLPYLHECQYLIDDRPRTLVQFVYDYVWREEHPTKLRKAFGLHHPWNAALTDVDDLYLAPNWRGLHTYLQEKLKT